MSCVIKDKNDKYSSHNYLSMLGLFVKVESCVNVSEEVKQYMFGTPDLSEVVLGWGKREGL